MTKPLVASSTRSFLSAADGSGWPAVAGLAAVPIDLVPARVRAGVAGGDPVHVLFYCPGVDRPVAEVGQAVRAVWAADPRVQVILGLSDVERTWTAVREQLRPGDNLIAVPAGAVTGPAAAQLAAALSAKWVATAAAGATAAEVDRRVAARTADLHRVAVHDRLTGLGNRVLLNDRLADLIEAGRADPDRKFAVLFLDFDRFKVVNDSLGHDVGDGLLVAIADRLRATLRDTDTVSVGDEPDVDSPALPARTATAARLGGDEFILLLDHLRDHADAVRVAGRVLENLSAPYHVQDHLIHSTASVGITTSAVGYTSAAAMLRDADTAMYRAKAAGKARYVLFDTQMHREAVDRLTLEGDLRQALDKGEFGLCYQPIVRLDTGAVTGFEVLLRWNHPTRGPVPPAVFVPVAEEIGFMVALGDWVVDAACRQLADWRARHPAAFADLSVHVNLSRRQLAAPGFADQLEVTLGTHGLPPAAVHLEITERAVLDDPQNAGAVLARLRELGVELHLDNFGTGQSSLSCLHRYPLSGLKIDASFVRDALTRDTDLTVLTALVALARNLNLHLVAEGVETSEQLALLRRLGCDRAQGYAFSRALDADDAEAFVVRTIAAV